MLKGSQSPWMGVARYWILDAGWWITQDFNIFLKYAPVTAARPATRAPIKEDKRMSRNDEPPRGNTLAIFCERR